MAKVIATLLSRRGKKNDFDATKMKSGEFSVVEDTKEVYVSFEDGTADEIVRSSVKSVNGKIPDNSGSVTVSAADIKTGMLPSSQLPTVPVSKGGTNKTSWASNQLIYPTGTDVFGQLAFPGTAGSFLRQGTSGAPYWTPPADVSSAIGAIPKVSPAVAGNLAILTATGEFEDSGQKPGDFAFSGFSGDMYHAGSDTALDALIDNVIAVMPEQSYKHIFVGFTTTEVTLGGGWYFFKIYKDDNNYVMLHGTSYNSGGKNVQRARFGGAWGAWEWVNPPMAMGTEYRTTERWNGSVVYTKLVDCGLSASSKTVSSGVSTAYAIIRDAVVVNGQPMTQRSDDDIVGVTRIYSKIGGVWQIQLTAGSSIINEHTYVQMWYIK